MYILVVVIFMYYINSFFIYSILGYIFEMLFGFVTGANNPESGVLYGPWTPIYGIASILIIIISEKIFKNFHLKRWKETLIAFFIIVPVLMLLEWTGGVLIEIIFGFTFWEYNNYTFEVAKYTCFEMGLIWGIIAIVFIYIIRPFLDKYIKKIPMWLTIIVSILFTIDFIIRLIVEFNII